MKKCPYCNKGMIIPPLSYTYYLCNNHGNVHVEIDNSGLFLCGENCFIMVNYRMTLCYKNCNEIYLPLDKSLTPENFEEKLNFYLMFK